MEEKRSKDSLNEFLVCKNNIEKLLKFDEEIPPETYIFRDEETGEILRIDIPSISPEFITTYFDTIKEIYNNLNEKDKKNYYEVFQNIEKKVFKYFNRKTNSSDKIN